MNLELFKTANLFDAATDLFQQLGIKLNSNTAEALPARDLLKDFYKNNDTFNAIRAAYFIGLIDDSVFRATGMFDVIYSIGQALDQADENYDGLMLFALELSKKPTRTEISDITRAFNRISQKMPVALVFKYTIENETVISISISERFKYLQNWRQGEKVGKISVLKDINIVNTHRGHVAILDQLVIPDSGAAAVRNFTQLYYYWQSVFSISVLNKKFYEEIIGWFNKAIREIQIPDTEPGSEKHKDFTVRLIARLIFVWFLKELKVIKDELLLPEFNNRKENDLIKPKIKGSGYYKFVLQNLFFNALNCEKEDRDPLVFDVYAANFTDFKTIKEAVFYSPYLNGGLFDIHQNDWCQIDKAGLHIVKNNFSVPDHLFLDTEKGLNGILAKYKFTIAENTPLEEEIAVDPEMLGRIFENLLAEQSDDTKEAARKNTGAFYTPRSVVSYMCRSTLLKHLNTEIRPENSKVIIKKLLETTVLDPACGSGAFPMGMLEEMMQVLTTVDQKGEVWVAEMMKSRDEIFREHISEMYADGQIRYVKKLGLLRNCLFGVDLLDYAIEITKLRCWLSLIVEQRVDFSKKNYNLKPLPNLEFKFYKKNSLFRFYKEKNLNELIDQIDNENLLKELINLENQYFITKSDRHGTKEEIKEKIIKLLERVVQSQSLEITKQLNSIRTAINQLISNKASDKEILKLRKKEKSLAGELGDVLKFKEAIKDYFIERVVFPGIFNKNHTTPGFDIVIGNPPYVNTKLINSMGISKKLEEEYGFCDDLYNHFTIRGLELLKSGGLLCYITSDTFLTLQTKKNMRMQFLGIADNKSGEGQNELFGMQLQEHTPPANSDLFGKKESVQTLLIPVQKEVDNQHFLPECKIMEIINTPKAFAALVDTAIFTVKKERAIDKPELVYIDIRKPNAASFNISEEEWLQIRTSKENLSGWERILDRTFSALNHDRPEWKNTHACDGDPVYKDENSTLLKYKVSFEPFRKAINYAIFSPAEYNCQILEKIIKPARPVYDKWWSRIETSRQIENNRNLINAYIQSIKPDSVTLIGLMTDGGQGLATGNNGRFVGYRSTSRFADRCKETRVEKLWEAMIDHPQIKGEFSLLSKCESSDDVREILRNLGEIGIWELFDGIKEKFGLRVFGKGYMYRVIPESMVFDISNITEKQKLEGVKGKRTYVPYDKGDKEGNRWYSETPYLIDWSEETVAVLSTDSSARWQGYQFFFRNGFCWNESLNPNSSYIKCRLKNKTVNDVASMSLYANSDLGDAYIITIINSYAVFKVVREFLNNTVKIQINDIRKLPIKIPSEKDLQAFNSKFDECLAIKKDYIAGKIDLAKMTTLLHPIEAGIDWMVNRLYGIDVMGDTEGDDREVGVLIEEVHEEDEDLEAN